MSKTFRIRVYEIEHSGDVENASAWMRLAGASQVKLIEMSSDYSESAVFEVSVPEAKLERFREIRRQTEFIVASENA